MALQDPEFDKFKLAYKESRFQEALDSLDKVLAEHPHSFALNWHHVKVLEKLERFSDARIVLNKMLRVKSDFVPGLIMQVQLDFHEYEDGLADDESSSNPTAQTGFDLIEQRLYKILSIDPNAVDALHMLSGLLRGHEGDAHLAKANQLLNRAIKLAPERVDLLEDRANCFLANAMVNEDDTDPHETVTHETVTTFSGVRYSRDNLEQALTDFTLCYALSRQHRYGLRAASILHDLGRFEEALATYDSVLAKVPEDDPYRPFIIERRARSENNGAGEREQIAQLLESTIAKDGKDRTLDENNIAHAMLSAANAVRGGKSVSDALEARVSDDPDDNIATSIAVQILNVAHEPHPKLVAVDPKDFPAYQQAFTAKCKQDLEPLGLYHVCDAEATGMRPMLGQRVLLSFFADESGETGIACFTMKPKKPNVLGLLFLLLTGKWTTLIKLGKAARMVECVSQFNTGDHISTQYGSPSPFEYGAPIYIEKLPASSSPTELVERHLNRVAEHKQDNPNAFIMRAIDLDGMEERWLQGQAVEREYRVGVGYVTELELQTLLGAHYDKFAHKVKAKLQVLAADF